MYAIKTENLTKKYKDVTAVDNLNLSVERGELLSLLGVNGAGKTTTIKMLSCLTQPTSGDAFLGGKSIITDVNGVKSLIAVSPQETAVAKGLTVMENLALICGVHGFSKEQRKTKIQELTRLLGLESVINKKAGKLSGGWQRRLSIAMALISEPEILFLDEPTLGLDVLARSDLWDIIRSLKGRVTMILTTHYMEEVEILCDRVIILDKGKIIASGTNDELKALAKIEEKVTIEVPELSPSQLSGFESIKNVSEVSYDNGVMKVVFNKGKNNLADMVDYLKDNKIRYNKIFAERPTLNDVFLELTGKELRD